MPALGRIRTVDTVSVNLPRAQIRKIAVPDFVGVFGQAGASDLAFAILVEQAEFHRLGIFREQGEVHPFSVPGRSEGIRSSRPYPGLALGHVVSKAAIAAAPRSRRSRLLALGPGQQAAAGSAQPNRAGPATAR